MNGLLSVIINATSSSSGHLSTQLADLAALHVQRPQRRAQGALALEHPGQAQHGGAVVGEANMRRRWARP